MLFSFELFNIKTKTRTEIFFNFILYAGSIRVKEKDDVTVLSGILDGSRRFEIILMTNDLKLVSEYQDKHLNLF